MADATNRLNIYLIRHEFTHFDDIVKPGLKQIEVDGVGTVYLQEASHKPAGWVKTFFGNTLDASLKIYSANSKAVLLVKVTHDNHERIFALAFALGRYLLNDNAIEERFGLKVVLNSVEGESLRSIDRTALGSVPKQSREQVSKESGVASFGLDIEQDLVNAVTGRSLHPVLGKTISGRDSLSLSVKVDINDVVDFLPKCLELYESVAYKKEFDWIDQIRDVRDPATVDKLNAWLLDQINGGHLERIWMAPPTVVNWVDVAGFRYKGKKRGDLHPDMELTDVLATMPEGDVTLDALKSKNIYAISATNGDDLERWPAFKCLYAEANVEGDLYVLNNGRWYKIAENFTQRVIDDFNSIPESELELPPYDHANEGAYNDAVAEDSPEMCCMDRKVITHGGGHSSIEFCDLLTKDGHLVHVKHYSGSAQLSHLFNQGVVSGELFAQDGEFREKVNEKLGDDHKLVDPSTRPSPSDYEVVFAVISKSTNPLDIPFFSKVSLRNARRRLEGYGYKVTKKKIQNLKAA